MMTYTNKRHWKKREQKNTTTKLPACPCASRRPPGDFNARVNSDPPYFPHQLGWRGKDDTFNDDTDGESRSRRVDERWKPPQVMAVL